MEAEKVEETTTTEMGKEGTDASAAATKIQAGFRGYKVRKQMKGKKNGADEKAMKRSSGRRKSGSRRGEMNGPSDLEERSATKIQAGIRGFLVRKKQKEQIKPSS